MGDGISVDAREFHQLSDGMGKIPQFAGKYFRQAVEVSARHVKDEWADEAAGQLGAQRYPKSVTYDIVSAHLFGNSVIQAEVGPDKNRRGLQGPLGNLIEYGTAADGGLSSKVGTGAAALERTEADFVEGLAKASEAAERAAFIDSSITAGAAAVIRGYY